MSKERKEETRVRRRIETMTDLWRRLEDKFGADEETGEPNRAMPYDIEAERSLLASVLIDKNAMGRAAGIIGTPAFEDLPFISEQHAWIWHACMELHQEQKPIDWLTVTNRLKRMDKAGFCGAPGKLTELSEAFITAANVESHARIVQEKHIMREFIRGCEEFSARTSLDEEDVYDSIKMFSERLANMLSANDTKGKLEQANRFTVEAIEKIEQGQGGLTGVSTGLTDLDELTCGWQPSDLIIIGGRPSMGKTALSLTFVKGAIFPPPVPRDLAMTSEEHEKLVKRSTAWVAFFSLEMPSVMIILRLLCNLARVDMQRVRKKELTDADWRGLAKAMSLLKDAPFFIDDSSTQSMQDIAQKVVRLQSQMRAKGYEKGLVIIDYLGLLETNERVFDRNDEVRRISKAAKALAKDTKLPVIALSQLNRKVEDRRDGRPQMSDLRDSGNVEQDADVIGFIYRPERYNIETDRDGNSTKGLAEIIISKQRNGPIDDVKVTFTAAQQRFEDRVTSLYDNVAEPAVSADGPSF